MRSALHYLSFRPRSHFELQRHLERRGYSRRTVDHAIAACRRLGHVDDRAFAVALVRDRVRLRPRGRVALESELRLRGVDGETARAGIEQVFEEEQVDETTLARAVASHARAGPRADERTWRRRLEGLLRRRGFAPDVIARVVRELIEPH